ncbi:CLAVATA3/ESR (CLE)-related protein 1 [Prunus yedoensis var. nudiflora]|uniref:CLAVATA3/ESR (CLE)-related protein 1 n=1 Tax=Prunus yedoensis var. nudiflora TaxID=2094558 RepID=A0A314XT80_PRUYE|nr:CLAVATA3/ESR (CLE)-related protein 1 [Prunus yedoensis var. nudiflora]
MASLKFWFCLLLVLLSFSSSDQARPLAPLLDKSNNKEAMMESAKQVLEATIERQVGKPLETSNRVSPGDPIPGIIISLSRHKSIRVALGFYKNECCLS